MQADSMLSCSMLPTGEVPAFKSRMFSVMQCVIAGNDRSLLRLDDEDEDDVAADNTAEEVEVMNAMTDTNNVSVIMLSTLDYNIPVLDCKYK